jgi:hypothetical protein
MPKVWAAAACGPAPSGSTFFAFYYSEQPPTIRRGRGRHGATARLDGGRSRARKKSYAELVLRETALQRRQSDGRATGARSEP